MIMPSILTIFMLFYSIQKEQCHIKISEPNDYVDNTAKNPASGSENPPLKGKQDSTTYADVFFNFVKTPLMPDAKSPGLNARSDSAKSPTYRSASQC